MSDIAVVNEDGEVGTLPTEQAKQGFASGALRPANVQEITGLKATRRKAAIDAKYGDAGGMATAAGLGILRGATLGLSDPLITGGARLFGGKELAQSAHDSIKGHQEANPITSGIGEVGGMVLPALVSGGASTAAEAGMLSKAAVGSGQAMRAIGTPVRALTGIGGAVEGGVATALGGGTLAKIGSKAAAAGVEGALFGASREMSNQLTEEAIGNPGLNAERIFAAAGHDLVLGTALGGTLGIASAAVDRGSAALKRILSRKEVVDKLDDFAGNMAWNSARGTQKMAEKANKFAGGTDEVGKLWMRESQETLGKSFGKLTQEDLPELASAIKQKHAGFLDELIDKADELRTKRGFTFDSSESAFPLGPYEYLQTVKEKALARIEGQFGMTGQRKQVSQFIDDLWSESAHAADGVSVRNLRDMRIGADRKWAGNRAMPDVANPIKAVRDVIESDVMNFMEVAAKNGPKNFAAEYKAAKRGWQAGELLEKAAARGNAAGVNNQFLSLTDKITASMGGTVGGVLGGVPGMVAGNMLSGVASKMVRSKFPFLAAEYSQKAARVLDLSRASNEVDRAIESNIKGLLTGSNTPSLAVRSAPTVAEVFGSSSEYQQAKAHKSIERIQQLAADAGHVDNRVGHVADYAPQHGVAMAAQYTRTLGYLSKNAPQPMNSSTSLGGGGKPVYSSRDVAKWAQLLKVASDPLTILTNPHRADIGTVGHVKSMYPELFRTMQQHLGRQILQGAQTGKKGKASLQTRVQLAQIFDIPYTLANPNFAARVKQPRTESSTGGNGRPRSNKDSGASARYLSTSLQSDTERLRR